MTTKRIIFHAGAPKTGTTSLQQLLGESEADLARAGTRFLYRMVKGKKFHSLHHVIRDLKQTHKAEKALERGRAILAREFETCDTLIISNEDALFDEKRMRVRKTLFTKVDRQTNRLATLFEGYEVRIFMTVRNWRSWLPSNYYQMVRQGETRSMKSFIESLSEEDMDWCHPVRALQTTFGKNAVFIMPYEQLADDQFCLLRRIMASAGVDFKEDVAMPAVNRTYGSGTIHYMRFWNWVFQLRRRTPKTRRFIRHHIYPWLTYWLTFTPTLRLKGALGDKHNQRYQGQLSELELPHQ